VSTAPETATTGWRGLLRSRSRAIGLGIVVGGLALALALWGVPLREVGTAMATARPGWLLAVAVVFLVQQLLRAWRQQVLVRVVAPHHSYRTSLSVLCISFFFINTLPARLGELTRPLLLLERDDVPLGAGVATVFLERAVDLLATFVMLALVVLVLDLPTTVVTVGDTEVDVMRWGRTAAATAIPLVVAGTLAVVWLGPRLLLALAPLAARPGWLGRIAGTLVAASEGFVEALAVFRQPSRVALVAGLTVATWALTIGMYPLMGLALGLGERVDYAGGLVILAISMIGMILPAAPGFAGTYEAAVRVGLALIGVAGVGLLPGTETSLDAVAVAYALCFHWWIYVVQAATAVGFLAVDRISVRALMQRLAAILLAPPPP